MPRRNDNSDDPLLWLAGILGFCVGFQLPFYIERLLEMVK